MREPENFPLIDAVYYYVGSSDNAGDTLTA